MRWSLPQNLSGHGPSKIVFYRLQKWDRGARSVLLLLSLNLLLKALFSLPEWDVHPVLLCGLSSHPWTSKIRDGSELSSQGENKSDYLIFVEVLG